MANHASNESRTITERFVDWCAKDTAAARFERSVAQGIIGVGTGIFTATATNDPILGTVVAPVVMAILAPIQKAIGNKGEVGDGNE